MERGEEREREREREGELERESQSERGRQNAKITSHKVHPLASIDTC